MRETYQYYLAFKPDGSLKDGINRIIYYNEQEFTREYIPELTEEQLNIKQQLIKEL